MQRRCAASGAVNWAVASLQPHIFGTQKARRPPVDSGRCQRPFRYAALVDPTSPDHYTVASHAMSIAKTTNPVAAEIMMERSTQFIRIYLVARAKYHPLVLTKFSKHTCGPARLSAWFFWVMSLDIDDLPNAAGE